MLVEYAAFCRIATKFCASLVIYIQQQRNLTPVSRQTIENTMLFYGAVGYMLLTGSQYVYFHNH